MSNISNRISGGRIFENFWKYILINCLRAAHYGAQIYVFRDLFNQFPIKTNIKIINGTKTHTFRFGFIHNNLIVRTKLLKTIELSLTPFDSV